MLSPPSAAFASAFQRLEDVTREEQQPAQHLSEEDHRRRNTLHRMRKTTGPTYSVLEMQQMGKVPEIENMYTSHPLLWPRGMLKFKLVLKDGGMGAGNEDEDGDFTEHNQRGGYGRGGGQRDRGYGGGNRGGDNNYPGASAGGYDRQQGRGYQQHGASGSPRVQGPGGGRYGDRDRSGGGGQGGQWARSSRYADEYAEAGLTKAADGGFSSKTIKAQRADPMKATLANVTGIMNKISRDTFHKLTVGPEGLLSLNITSQEMLERVIDIVYEKALSEVFFQDMYADLCTLLGEKASLSQDICIHSRCNI
jgi:hypothetical protein